MAQPSKWDVRARVLYIFMYFLLLHEVEGSDCSAESLSNGKKFHLTESISTCNEFNWSVDGTVVANEIEFNRTIVLSRDSRSVTFKSCLDNVAYKHVCNGSTIKCPSCHRDPENLVPETSSRNSGHAGAVVGVMFLVLLSNLVILL